MLERSLQISPDLPASLAVPPCDDRAGQVAARDFEVAGVPMVADLSGGLWLTAERILVVTDLHLEKGSAFARRRLLLPPYDTSATLARLGAVVIAYAPRTIIALGDSFHDCCGAARMSPMDRAALRAMQVGRDWLWIAGNHDRTAPIDCGGEFLPRLSLGTISLVHEPSTDARAEIAGHLHPVARIAGRAGSVRRRCFVADQRRCVMPAFGAYAGGLNIRDPAFEPLFPCGDAAVLALGRERVHAVSRRRCIADP